ncbi:heme o synthase [Thalassotalea sp. ND16A]|uniref:heme o synthase n=1 Tax=Thalassotalea sp. ND16A TaxID=1535422 RepID=UPI000519F789|nr:heme o synthase [Thalassotalea sp. ND16A]KGJ96497.1 hypothetical protein ND16A_1079 [Thalassotalea sp. ND16A]
MAKITVVEDDVQGSWQDYVTLCKPKVVLLLLITAFVGMQLTITDINQLSSVDGLFTMLLALIGIGFAASAAAIVNHLVDANIDAKMQRTKHRPMVLKTVSDCSAILLAISLSLISMLVLVIFINPLTALLTFAGLIGYAFIYTFYLKHKTPQNIVIGGLSGALPPLLGWTAMTNDISMNGLMLLAFIFVWTPAHFWALAIDRVEDYKKANVPMLPVVKGISHTKSCVLVYTCVTIVVSMFPYFNQLSGGCYLLISIVAGAWYLSHAVKLKYFATAKTAIKCFYASIYYLFAIFVALLFDHYLMLLT